ncbi:MAG TPA: hypothetical protein VMZ53_31435 [Kofleriaceae bacterium]|nr:hypothetical protein [Kofleriaceae bacterium]
MAKTPAKPQQSDPLFAALKALVKPYAKHFKVFEDTDQHYDLEEDLRYSRTMFAVLYKRPREVRFYFYPLNVWPDLRELLPASLQSQITGKWIIKVAVLGPAEKKALAKMLAEAWRRIAAIRALAKQHPFYRKFDLEDTHALITKIARKATVELRKKDVQVTLPNTPTVIPAVLGPRVFKPGIFRFKSITPDEHAALAALTR